MDYGDIAPNTTERWWRQTRTILRPLKGGVFMRMMTHRRAPAKTGTRDRTVGKRHGYGRRQHPKHEITAGQQIGRRRTQE